MPAATLVDHGVVEVLLVVVALGVLGVGGTVGQEKGHCYAASSPSSSPRTSLTGVVIGAMVTVKKRYMDTRASWWGSGATPPSWPPSSS